MKNRNSIRRVEKIGEKILRPPSLNVKGSRPQSKKENRKFGDNLTNLSIFQECKEEEFREKNVLVQKVKGTNKRAQIQDYLLQITNYLLQQDVNFYTYLTNSMELAPNIKVTSDMRKTLIKWLKQVSYRFGFLQETLHIACQLIDILLIEKGLLFDKTNFQLLGITSLFIACKYNEIQILDSSKFLYVCDGLYCLDNLLQMQALILESINFKLQLPTIFNFLQTQMNVYNVNKKGRKFISDFGSWCLLDFNLMNNYKKSEIVTFLIHFADKIMNIGMNENSKGKDLNRKCLEGAMMLMNRIYEEFCKKENSFNNQ